VANGTVAVRQRTGIANAAAALSIIADQTAVDDGERPEVRDATTGTLQRHLVIDNIASHTDAASGALSTDEEAEDVTSLSDGK